MARPYWLDDEGRPVDEGIPFSQHVRDYHFWVSLERMRSFRAELHHHQDPKAAKLCLSYGGCIAPCDHFRNDYLSRVDELAAISQQSDRVFSEMRQRFAVAAPVTPPLCLMGETHTQKTIKNAAAKWLKNNAS